MCLSRPPWMGGAAVRCVMTTANPECQQDRGQTLPPSRVVPGIDPFEDRSAGFIDAVPGLLVKELALHGDQKDSIIELFTDDATRPMDPSSPASPPVPEAPRCVPGEFTRSLQRASG